MKRLLIVVMLLTSLVACGGHQTAGPAGAPKQVYVATKNIPLGTPAVDLLKDHLAESRTVPLKEVRPGTLAESDFPLLIARVMIRKGSQLVAADFTRISNSPGVPYSPQPGAG